MDKIDNTQIGWLHELYADEKARLNVNELTQNYNENHDPLGRFSTGKSFSLKRSQQAVMSNAMLLGLDGADKIEDSKKVMNQLGWVDGDNNREMLYPNPLSQTYKEQQGDVIVYNGSSESGKLALTNGGYKSNFYDTDNKLGGDAPSIYTTPIKGEASVYSDGDESNVSRLVIRDADIVSRENVIKLKEKLGGSLAEMPDNAIAALAGYDVMKTIDGDVGEYAVMNPAKLYLYPELKR